MDFLTPSRDLARLLRLFESLPDAVMRSVVLIEHLCAWHGDQSVASLDVMLRRAMLGDPRARLGAFALAQWLVAAHSAPHSQTFVAELRQRALDMGSALIGAILTEAPAHKALPPLGRLREVCVGVHSPIPLSARILGGPTMRALLNHHNPIMVGRLLDDKALRPGQALWIAARRPTTRAIALQLASRPRWFKLGPIRVAMATNPYTPTTLTAPMLPTLPRPALEILAFEGNIHPDALSATRCLLDPTCWD